MTKPVNPLVGKLLAVLESKKISVRKAAPIIGIPSDRIYKWESQGTTPKAEDQDKINLFLRHNDSDISPEWAEFGKNLAETRKGLKHERKNAVPFYDAPAAAGMTETEMSPIHAPAGTIDVGDLLHDSQAAIRIYGNSMLPSYPPGCVVGLIKRTSSYIEPGEVYVIETRDQRMLKRLFYKDDDSASEFFTCYSDNIMKFDGGARHGKLAYPPFDLPRTEIINIFTVTGVIKRNSNSVIMNR